MTRWSGSAAPLAELAAGARASGGRGASTHPNNIFTWEARDKAAADAAFKTAEITVREEILNPRVHPCPLETCGCVASFNKAPGYLTVYMTSQAPPLFYCALFT